MTAALIAGGVVVVAALAWRAHQSAKRERMTAARLHDVRRQMDERAAQSMLRPRTGNVVASVRLSKNGSR